MRLRAPRLAAALAAIAGLAGCTAASSSVTVAGQTLTIYASLPSSAATPENQDVLDAEQLALQQNGSKIGNFTLRLAQVKGAKASDDARTAIQDTTAIAYLGEVAPGASGDSVGITNSQDLLQVSPTDTALALTQATVAVPSSPGLYYESSKTYGRTFARVVPTTLQEARALVSELPSLHVTRLYVTDDGSDYGKTIALEVKNALGESAAATVSGADGVFYGGSSASGAERTFAQALASNPSIKLLAPSALAEQSFVSALSPSAQHALTVTEPGFFKDLSTAGQKFQTDFTAAFGHAPAPQAIFGYEAMASVLAVLREAGSAAGNRATVVRDYYSIKNRQSVLGTYSITGTGDTDLDAFTASRVRAGRLVPFKPLIDQR
jgi:branched-chain amino acid transport system substrate-binding protein